MAQNGSCLSLTMNSAIALIGSTLTLVGIGLQVGLVGEVWLMGVHRPNEMKYCTCMFISFDR